MVAFVLFFFILVVFNVFFLFFFISCLYFLISLAGAFAQVGLFLYVLGRDKIMKLHSQMILRGKVGEMKVVGWIFFFFYIYIILFFKNCTSLNDWSRKKS